MADDDKKRCVVCDPTYYPTDYRDWVVCDECNEDPDKLVCNYGEKIASTITDDKLTIRCAKELEQETHSLVGSSMWEHIEKHPEIFEDDEED